MLRMFGDPAFERAGETMTNAPRGVVIRIQHADPAGTEVRRPDAGGKNADAGASGRRY
jgi:hypothetical protein